MYGMIHRGIREMVIETKGAGAWAEVEKACKIGPVELVSASVYDDELSFAIVGASAQVLGMNLQSCLRAFGRYWVRFAERGSYGAIMNFTGQDLESFIANLDRMHAAVNLALPEARTPTFKLLSSVGSELHVRYKSDREGLEPLVEGLLEGLLLRFKQKGTVRQIAEATEGADFVITLVQE